MKKRNVKSSSKKSTKEIKTRVTTGINKFDSLIEGGFPGNSTNLLVGSSGAGKSIFATQFLIGGMDKGEKCLYVTFEEKKAEFYKNMAEFGWNLEDYEKKGLLKFIEYTPSKVKTMLEEGGGEIESLIVKNKIKRVVIDSITSFALLFNDELSKREASLSLFNLISSWSCTSLLTYEEDSPEKLGSSASSKALEFEADSIINLYYIRNNNVRERYLEVVKMRGTKHSRCIHKVELEKKGLTVTTSPSKIKLSD